MPISAKLYFDYFQVELVSLSVFSSADNSLILLHTSEKFFQKISLSVNGIFKDE